VEHNCILAAYHGVLAHEDNTLATETQTNLVHLLRADIVDGDDEDGLVLVEEALELIEVSGLGSRFAPHVFLSREERMFKGKWKVSRNLVMSLWTVLTLE
jgi:hypothetical protein